MSSIHGIVSSVPTVAYIEFVAIFVHKFASCLRLEKEDLGQSQTRSVYGRALDAAMADNLLGGVSPCFGRSLAYNLLWKICL